MKAMIVKTWPLFFGLTMLMIGNGLQGTLLGVRANIESFPVIITGLIMSAYYIGFFLGTLKIPHYIESVGHIRVFAAMASLASSTVLIHGLVIDPFIWCVVRFLSGVSFAGLFIVVESWLNDAATNKTRGKILGFYMVMTYLGMAIGQYLLNFSDPESMTLFLIISILISISLLPISLSKRPAPEITIIEPLKTITVWKRSPLGVSGVFMSGFATAAIFSIAPIFTREISLDILQLTNIMSAFLVGTILLQMPIAYISDVLDRRKVIVTLSILSLGCCVSILVSYHSYYFLLIFMALLGGVSLPIYSQCVSHVNDHLLPKQFIAASSNLLLVNAIGACIGPIAATVFIRIIGETGFIMTILLAFLFLSTFAVYRLFVAKSVPLDDQNDAFIIPNTSATNGFPLYADEDNLE